MNCHDVSLILDDRDAGTLGAAERREMDAHLAICADCTGDWQIHTRLAAARVPAVPVDLQGRIRAQLPARFARPGGWRAPRRLLLLTLLAAGAAAAMFGYQLLPTADPAVEQVSAVVPAPVAETETRTEALLPPVSVPATPEVAVPRNTIGPVPPAPRLIRVQVMPLLNQATGEAIAAVDEEYGLFLDALRKVPGVTLVPSDASAAEPAEFRLTLRGIGPLAAGQFRVSFGAQQRQADGSFRAMVSTMNVGDIVPACTNAGLQLSLYGPCTGPAMIAAQQVQFVRANLIFMPQPSDPAAISHSILSSSTSDIAENRATAWRVARGVRLPELIQPLITAVQQDRDAGVRAHAAATLAADFGDDTRVRAALDTASRSDASPMVRAFVQQTLNGDQAWNAYLVESMRDTSHTSMERLEALFFAVEQPAAAQFDLEGVLRRYDAIESLAALLSGISPWPKTNQMTMLVGRVAQIEHPAAVKLLVENLDRYAELMPGATLVYLLSLHGGDARVRAALEKISTSDPDPNLRQAAVNELKKIAAAGAAQSPTR